ncbi:uncharacterized protein LOC106639256 [Copidosoma floridanum]|uniref:uncharacterized protein LOC106639256 n=1 Tax=Copidosoma floridanum TaxID=29053 RepID=UPI0006C9612C|nr:uncharacterized protein LOC106639256 [Copidosoma floridanum]
MPKYYTWNQSTKKFQHRKQGIPVPDWPQMFSTDALGRMYTVHPRNDECFYLQLLLEFVRNNVPLLSGQQKQVYETLMQAVDNNTGGLFLLDAPGGTGKTFVISFILATIRSRCDMVLALASSGIVATLLDGGRTAHSALKLPLNLNTIDTPTCDISRSSAMGKLLMQCKLIFWDECTMTHKKSLEALNFTLKNLRRNNNIFGGLMILLAGDFRQTLTVIPRGTPTDELNACPKASPLWNNSAAQFSKQLLAVGNGKVPVDATSGLITLTNDFGRFVDSQLSLIENVFPNIKLPGFSPHNLQLKVNTVIMILHNLNLPPLCNGTRLLVKRLTPNLIETTINYEKYAELNGI